MRKTYRAISAFLLATTLALPASADLTQILDQLPSEVERRSAITLQAIYDDLIENSNCFDGMQGPNSGSSSSSSSVAAGAVARGTCDGQTFKLFSIARSFVHTANSFSGSESGSTQYSLDVDIEDLGKALRWSASEEYSAQGAISNSYARNQATSLTTRLNSLRMGAQGFSVGFNGAGQSDYADTSAPLQGGGAGSESYSRWGGFVNVSVGKGDKSATDLEDAFDVKSNQYTAGLDYSLNDSWTLGVLTNYIDQKVDFNKTLSVVEGKIDATGYDISPFAMYQKESFYISGSIAYQKINFDSVRGIRYISNNPNTPSVDTKTFASADANNKSYFIGTGYNFSHNKFSLEPFLNYNSVRTSIDAFTEEDEQDSAFDVHVNSQRITQNSFNVGLTTRYTFTPSAAVVTPYVTIEMVQRQNDKGKAIESYYVNASSQSSTLSLPTDSVDKTYMVNTLGVSSVLIGSHQDAVGGELAGGLQIFAQYKQIKGLSNYSADEYILGLRYEF